MQPRRDTYDVVVIGGALAGASTALTLLRDAPELRVLIVERSERFRRRVGEATVELSGYFLTRVLGLTRYLNDAHLAKQGLRFWFSNDEATSLDACSEIGPNYLARIPSFMVDRAELDQEVLDLAVGEGAELSRPAKVRDVELRAGENQRVTLDVAGASRTIEARWVVDASGFGAFLSRRNGWWRENDALPTAAVWSRWRGVGDWDGLELARRYPEWSRACVGVRGTATNHLVGDGWWAWCIPLKGGDTSIGVVYDQRFVTLDRTGGIGDSLKRLLCEHPAGRELLRDATWIDGDVNQRRALPYHSTTYAGDGFVTVGDAAAFLDPFYSPGMDFLSFTVWTARRLVLEERRGADVGPLVERHNRDMRVSYARWFESLYRDKYLYMGDFELMRIAFLLDLGFYYFGVVGNLYRIGHDALLEPMFSSKLATPFYHIMSAYNRRLAQLAVSRRRRGTFGRKNAHRRENFPGYTLALTSLRPMLKATALWLALELTEGWRTWWPGSARFVPQPRTVASRPARSEPSAAV